MSASFFFCKQKTAYERRISDWSSDVFSSDLCPGFIAAPFTKKPTSRIFIRLAIHHAHTLTHAASTPLPLARRPRHLEGCSPETGPDTQTPTSGRCPVPSAIGPAAPDRKSVVKGKSVSVSVNHGGRRDI